MNVSAAGLSVLMLCGVLVSVRSNICTLEGKIYICQEIPQSYPAGLVSLVLFVSNVGAINRTVFSSDNLASITRLTINNAGITDIASRALWFFRNLKTLSLDLNNISQLNPAWFSQPAILQNLTLIQNHIEVVEDSMLSGLTGLISLNLTRNMIKSIAPGSFSTQTHLASLDLSGNRIVTISPGSFSGLTGLTSLNLARNRIKTISPGCFSTLTSLAYLDLSDNRLTRVNPQDLLPLSPATQIRLDGNPWDCSCGVEDFVIFLRGLQNASLLEREMEVTCASPSALRGQPVWNVSKCLIPNPQPQEDTHIQPPAMSITVSTLIAVIVWRRKRETKQVKPSLETKEEEEAAEQPDSSTLHRQVASMSDWDPELAARIYRSGVRAKSADAVLSTSQFCRAEREAHRAVVETERELYRTEGVRERPLKEMRNSEEEKSKEPGDNESQGVDRNLTGKDDIKGEVSQENDRDDGTVNLQDGGQNIICVSQDSETIPYLTIGADPAEPNLERHKGPSPQKVMTRISTWPPTSAQWQTHFAIQREGLCVFPENDPGQEVEGGTENQSPDHEVKQIQSPDPGETKNQSPDLEQEFKDETDNRSADVSVSVLESSPSPIALESSPPEGDMGEVNAEENCSTSPEYDPVSLDDTEPEPLIETSETLSDLVDTSLSSNALTQTETNPGQENPEELDNKPTQIINRAVQSEGKSNRNGVPKRAGRSRESTAPPSGVSPSDDNLLLDNEYVYIDLLHEVVQNQGRWTRERWKQTHLNKAASKRSKHQGH
ncbi:uncharacterized protein isoform X2 [Salmo salar]|uniref:Uncharacterized protein isoform X2 n=1 Tax=Salmo salar TaxID=8030 RepID=A0A1S3PGC0_SALSA|nr:uncharacterized protein LOC106585219 isoform X2 [Salmo salar]